jgi:methionyl-tRNA synthetase
MGTAASGRCPATVAEPSSLSVKRTILVTSALPYANNSLHLGHMLGYIQTDIWVRFQRLRGARCFYVCASDAHGTPTMLQAEREGIAPETLVERVSAEHARDFATYRISVDNYLTTHSAENEELTTELYRRLKAGGFTARRKIKQAYDEARQMFLPDRYVRGTCPVCNKPDQYGDSCENCGATYSPLDLKDALSTVSGTAPTVRESEHLFLKLSAFETELRNWVEAHVDTVLARKLDEWFKAGLRDWDISRDAPYFGFRIPEEQDKFFYVWFDAPIGYMASFLNLCRRLGLDFEEFWGVDSRHEVYHFIGKDIPYFHALFWPAMLSGAGYRKPSGLFVHGHVTVDSQKISKRRGNYITAAAFAAKLDPDYLRYYYAAKLGSTIDDLDLNLADFVVKVNADLVGKLVNIASRCAGFVHKLNAGRLADKLAEPKLYADFAAAADDLAQDFEQREFARAVRKVMALADRANQYIDDRKPWLLVKNLGAAAEVVAISTVGLNLFRALIVYLKPIVPALAARAEKLLGGAELDWQSAAKPLLGASIAKFEPLLTRVDPAAIEALAKPTTSETTVTTVADADMDVRGRAMQARAGMPEVEQRMEQLPGAIAEIDLPQFQMTELRVARIIEASYVDGADKLLKLRLDVGTEERTVFSGIRSSYEPAALANRLVVLVANLAPRKMRFGVSQGMVLAASGDEPGIFLLSPDSGAKPGMKVS